MPITMRAAILVDQRQPLIVDEVLLPPELNVGQVLVRVHASGICGSQIGEIDGVKGPDAYLPHLLGHEGAGRVEAVGPGVRHVRPGDLVVLHWRKGRGIDAAPPTYQWRGQPLNAGQVTTFSELTVASENRVTPVPGDSDLQVLPLFGCAVTTGFGVVTSDARLTIGDSVVVVGAGGIGLNIVQAAALVSAFPIVAVDLHDERLELASAFGATHLINSSHQDLEAELDAIFRERGGADCFIDNTGIPDIIELGYRATGPEGRVVLVGVPAAGRKSSIHTLPLHFGKTITGSHGGDSLPHVDIPRYLGLYREGRIALRQLITDTYPLDEVNEAIEAIRTGKSVGRCLLEMG